jgi:hypothetical protein
MHDKRDAEQRQQLARPALNQRLLGVRLDNLLRTDPIRFATHFA